MKILCNDNVVYLFFEFLVSFMIGVNLSKLKHACGNKILQTESLSNNIFLHLLNVQ